VFPAHRVCIKVIAIRKGFSFILGYKAQLIKRIPVRMFYIISR